MAISHNAFHDNTHRRFHEDKIRRLGVLYTRRVLPVSRAKAQKTVQCVSMRCVRLNSSTTILGAITSSKPGISHTEASICLDAVRIPLRNANATM